MRRCAALVGAVAGLAIAGPAYAGTLDQQQTTYAGNFTLGLNGTERVAAQTFTAGQTGQLDQVDLPVGYTQNCQPTGDLIVQIQTVANGLPSGTVLATASLASSAIGEEAGSLTPFAPIAFASPALVTTGTAYAIVLSAPQAGACVSETAYYEWQLGADDPYTTGAAYFSATGAATWSAFGNTDAAFRTYVAPPPPPPDTDPPRVAITKGAPNKTKKSKIRFKFESNEPGSTFECKKDKKPWKPCTSPTKMKGLDEGKHKFKVRATDAAGNLGPAAKDKFKVVD